MFHQLAAHSTDSQYSALDYWRVRRITLEVMGSGTGKRGQAIK